MTLAPTSRPDPLDAGALLLRLSLASMWISHALLKLMVYGLAGTQGFFAAVGLPPALAAPVIAVELAGGAAIALGWQGRRVSLALLPVLLGASFVHAGKGWVFTAPGGGWEYPVFLIAMSLVHALIGDGRYALGGKRPSEGARALT